MKLLALFAALLATGKALGGPLRFISDLEKRETSDYPAYNIDQPACTVVSIKVRLIDYLLDRPLSRRGPLCTTSECDLYAEILL